jgi:D-serine deaminase-like pyridoxal phosphate-dependent protein
VNERGSADALVPSLHDPLLDGAVKGWPRVGCRASELAPGALSVEDLPTPVLCLREGALSANIAALASWCAEREILLAPHAKTTMAPALLRRQLAAGARGLTAADGRQARVALASGADSVLIANELVNEHELHWLASWNAASQAGIVPSADLCFCIDSIAGLELAEGAHRRSGGPPLRVLLELGYRDGRCGVREEGEALELARLLAASDHLSLCGAETYEGLVGDSEHSSALTRVDELLDRLAAIAVEIAPLVEHEEPIMTAGGSAYFDRVAERLGGPCRDLGWRLCIRSGCYVTHDHGLYEGLSPYSRGAQAPRFEPAIEVRTTVLSRPQRDRLILDCGRRELSYDAGLPVVIAPASAAGGLRLLELNDQHAHVLVAPDCEVSVGAVLTLGISHPCTALERWRVLPLIDHEERVLEAMPTYF